MSENSLKGLQRICWIIVFVDNVQVKFIVNWGNTPIILFLITNTNACGVNVYRYCHFTQSVPNLGRDFFRENYYESHNKSVTSQKESYELCRYSDLYF